MSPKEYHTSSEGDLTKVNLEGCRNCPDMVWVSEGNQLKLGVTSGWHKLYSLQQKSPGDNNKDIVIRIRGRVWSKFFGKRLYPSCAAKNQSPQ